VESPVRSCTHADPCGQGREPGFDRLPGVTTWRAFAEVFVTLLVIMDPAGTAPVFVSLTREMAPAQRRWAALRTSGLAPAPAPHRREPAGDDFDDAFRD